MRHTPGTLLLAAISIAATLVVPGTATAAWTAVPTGHASEGRLTLLGHMGYDTRHDSWTAPGILTRPDGGQETWPHGGDPGGFDEVGGRVKLERVDPVSPYHAMSTRPLGATAFGPEVPLPGNFWPDTARVLGDARSTLALVGHSRRYSGKPQFVVIRRRGPEAPLERVEFATAGASDMRVALAGQRVVIAWSAGPPGEPVQDALFVQTVEADGTVTSPQLLSSPSKKLTHFEVVGHPEGGAHIAWSEGVSSSGHIYAFGITGAVRAAILAPGTEKASAAVTLPGADAGATLSGLAAVPGGGAVAAWGRVGVKDPRGIVAVTEVSPTSAASQPRRIAGTAVSQMLRLSASPDGHVEAWWLVAGPNGSLMESAHRDPDGRWWPAVGYLGCVSQYRFPLVRATYNGVTLATPTLTSQLAVGDRSPGPRCASAFRSEMPWEESRATPPIAAVPSPPAPAKLRLLGSSVDGGILRARVQITSRASGRVALAYRAAGRTTRFTAPVPAKKTNAPISFTVRKPLVSSQRRKGTGILTVSFSGNGVVRGDELRLRVAERKAKLKRTRTEIDRKGRLRVAGTVSPRATGVVRIRVGYTDGAGKIVFAQRTAPIVEQRDGRASGWSLSTPFPKEVTIAQLSIQYTGDLERRVRGEATAKRVER